ncbi:hypothetical protein [Mycolicibacterium sp.]|uniref:hypothetical protein n=1 Tax=Mycolicibacterium sp. TaxID=2320850 RepID=UPI003D1097BF
MADAGAIQPLISESPFVSWVYGSFSVTAFSAAGVIELVAAALVAVHPFAPRLSALASLSAIGLFTLAEARR